MEDAQAAALLSTIGSTSLSKQWKELDPSKKSHLLSQLKGIDIPTLHAQKLLINEQEIKSHQIYPFTHFAKSGNENDRRAGEEAISQGLVGCLIVAGGQGSRLRIEGPKGICAVTKIRKKSLFQLFAEKTLAASKKAGTNLPLAIMTSPLNHHDTLAFFEKNAFFGLEQEQITFFPQETLPLLDQNGHVFLEAPDTLAVGPDGNGGALHLFFKNGIWKKWYTNGIRYLNFILIDNPLADPFDAELIGYQRRQNSDVVVKCTSRKNPEESVGVLVQKNEKAAVIEYSELSEQERNAKSSDGSLHHLLANLSLFSFKMDFIKQIAKTQMPLHKAFKAVKFLDNTGRTVQAEKPMAWKFEKFIFDILPLASKVDALLYPRETCFAPLKHFSGTDSFETVGDAIQQRDQQIISEISGIPCTIAPLEISQEFYYPTPELLAKWKGKAITQSGYLDSYGIINLV